MIYRFQHVVLLASTCLIGFANQSVDSASQQESVIPGFGKTLPVETDVAIPPGTEFKVRFDVEQKAEPGLINRTFDLTARFINLHVAAGIPPEKIDIAIVVHGGAAFDVTRSSFYRVFNREQDNASEAAVATLQKHNVRFFLCGQSAAAQAIGNGDLLPGIKMALSAMTMHALLDEEGYSLNPF